VLLVDFAEESRLRYMGFRIIDDVEAVSHFVINQGIDFAALLALPRRAETRLEFSDEDLLKFQQVLRIKPGFTKGLLNLGTAYLLRDRLDLAERYFRDAIRSDPDYAPAYTALGSLLAGQQRVHEALLLYEQAAERQKNNPYLYYNLALVNFKLQRYKDAARAARIAGRAAAHSEEPFADPHHLLGIIAQIQGHHEEAREQFLKALALDPRLEDARARLDHIDDLLGASRPGSSPASVASEPARSLH
jgi:tetratricopeptide (TPR) repeat protein